MYHNVLVIGLAKSGVSAAKTLFELGAAVTITDIQPEEKLSEQVAAIKPYVKTMVLGAHPENFQDYDLAVISPGVPIDTPYIHKLKASGLHLIGEIELAYILCKGRFIGITGTNGKTTTTALTGEIFSHAALPYYVVGNIGTPAVSVAKETLEETTMVTEISSFQLETVETFKAHIAAVLNLTPDHLNRHKTMESYIDAKARIFENQDSHDFLVLNYDDEKTRNLSKHAKGKIFYFSRLVKDIEGVYVEDHRIKLNCFGTIEDVCSIDDLHIFGRHNIENALAATLITRLAGLPIAVIEKGLKSFKGVEHRIEYTATKGDVKFYNDSKGTNPDSTICAIDAMVRPTHLIAGGYEKDSDFTPMIEAFGDKVIHLILLGQTKNRIAQTAMDSGFKQITMVETMQEAVAKAYETAKPGEAILLSPACASWDMYDNFEQRGDHFKRCVEALEE